MKHGKIKAILTLAAVAVILASAVGFTLAYLFDTTGTVINTFEPGEIETDITEDFNGTTKTSVVITNKESSSISVYVRAAVVGNWYLNGEIVEAWKPEFTVGTNWHKGSDDYYYYEYAVAPGGDTTNLLGTQIVAPPKDSGAVLIVDVLTQAIQAEPDEAVKSAWGVTVNTADDGTKTISKN